MTVGQLHYHISHTASLFSQQRKLNTAGRCNSFDQIITTVMLTINCIHSQNIVISDNKLCWNKHTTHVLMYTGCMPIARFLHRKILTPTSLDNSWLSINSGSGEQCKPHRRHPKESPNRKFMFVHF